MASFAAKYIGKKFIQDKILKEKLDNKFGSEDPYFEQVPAARLDGSLKDGKYKKIRKALPPGLSKHDAQVLTKVKRRAYRLDMAFGSFMGLKFGWGSVLGIFPIFGDFADCFLGLLVIRTAKQVEGGLPANVLVPMYIWLLLDLVAGLIPFVGDIADAAILANTRNAARLEAYLRERGRKNLRESGLPVPDIDPSDPDEFDRFNAESPTNHTRREKRPTDRPRDGHRSQSSDDGVSMSQPSRQPSRPTQAKVRDDGRGGFFSYGSKRSRPADEEMGTAYQDSSRRSGRQG